MSTILAIDYGTKRIGLALAPDGVGVVLPFGVIENEQRTKNNEQLRIKINEAKPGKIILGLPLDMEGKETPMTERIRAFGASLQEAVSLPIEFVDERFTTAQGKRMEGGVSDDEKAAMVLLETYLEK